MVPQRLLATERALHRPICRIIDDEDYSVLRSVRFPTYYFGNAIAVRRPSAHDVHGWERITRLHLPRDRFGHYAFTFEKSNDGDVLARKLSERTYEVDEQAWMLADTLGAVSQVPDGFEIRRLQGDSDVRALYRAQGYSLESLDRTGRFSPLFVKTRYVTDAIGIHWFGLVLRGETELRSSVGIFAHDGVARLQDVITPEVHRRKGYASILLRFMQAYALDALRCDCVGLCGIADAIGLYARLGWKELGREYSVWRLGEP